MGIFSFFGSLFGGSKRKIAPIVPSPKDRVLNKKYRNTGDPPEVMRLDQPAPKDLPKKIKSNVELIGVSGGKSRENAIGFMMGSKRQLKLMLDKSNKEEKNLIKILGKWEYKKGKKKSGQLGWLPKNMFLDIEPYLKKPMGATIKYMELPKGKKPPVIKIEIWRGMNRKKV
jgi:hypothetical protein